MATKAVKVSEDLIEIARSESEVMVRSVGAQIEYWARLGRAVEARGAMGSEAVRALLHGEGSVQALEADDDAAYVTGLTERLESLEGTDDRIVRDLRRGGYAIASVDDEGRLIVQHSSSGKRSGKARSGKKSGE